MANNIEETKSPVTEGMLRIHKLLSRSLDVSISKCDEYVKTGIPSSEREGFLMYLTTFIRVMHAHHAGEDDVVFPRFTGVINAPYTRLKEDHIAISAILDNLEKDVATLDDLPETRKKLADIQVLWNPHIKAEETSFAASNLTRLSEKEQLALLDEVGKHSQKSSGPGSITIPFVLYNLNEEDRQEFLKDFPWVLRKVLIPILWRPKWKAMDPFLLN
ncbi:MAG TPA: hemerythrin domain-containing protein [Bacteroidales bacterium]|nr:hemerythrin domain-containing protein [Bacteroidales bacterium]